MNLRCLQFTDGSDLSDLRAGSKKLGRVAALYGGLAVAGAGLVLLIEFVSAVVSLDRAHKVRVLLALLAFLVGVGSLREWIRFSSIDGSVFFSLLEAKWIAIQARRLRRMYVARAIYDLRVRSSAIRDLFGTDLLAAMRGRFHVWVIFSERDAEASLLFVKGMRYLGLLVESITADPVGPRYPQSIWFPRRRHRQEPDIVFFAEGVRLGPIFRYEGWPKAYIPLSALAKGDIHSWEPVASLLMPLRLPPGSDLLLRQYLESAACLFESPPDADAARKPVNTIVR